MNCSATILLSVLFTCAEPFAFPQQPLTQPLPGPQESRPQAPLSTISGVQDNVRQGMAEFQAGKYSDCAATFQRVVVEDPRHVVGYNMLGNCLLRMKSYPEAINAFQKALTLRPGESHNEAGLIEAYVRSGMLRERDLEISKLPQLKALGQLPAGFHYLYDVIPLEQDTIEVVEFYPDLSGGYHYRYWFNHLDGTGKLVQRVALESDDIDQVTFAKEHPELAAAGGRRFSLDTYASNTHGTVRFYDGEPSYGEVKREAMEVFAKTARPVTTSTHNPAAGSAPAGPK